MSVLGDRYDYDVFFSYAWATPTGVPYLRDWTRAIADTVSGMLGIRFTAQYLPYLDRDQAKSGQDLEIVLKQAAERSGVFVAFISSFYNADYCRKEVEWFCDGLGLKGDQLAKRLCLVRVQETPDDIWPERFRGISGKPLLYEDLTDEHGQPKGMARFIADGSLAELADQINAIALDVGGKVADLRRSIEARDKYRDGQKAPDKPLYVFEAEPADQPKWSEYGKRIRDVPSIVLPPAPKAATAMSPDDDLKGCQGMLLLRSRSGDDFSRRIKSAYLARRQLFLDESSKPWIPWALLDEVDPAPPEQEIYDIPRVKLEGDWLSNLKQAMQC